MAAAVTALVVVPIAASAYTGQQYARQPHVSLQQARAKALKAYPGRITDQELEKERGGTELRYSFDIKHGATTHKVGIDARTGRLLENSVEGPNDD
ncbi:MAG: PepSY domain-containing protein [Alphaproteobacteria bacterium]|nr:PepSY domain-containing protein [Alphaproteobacteria bacterium]